MVLSMKDAESCPICSCKPIIRQDLSRYMFFLVCPNCGTTGRRGVGSSDAVLSWNMNDFTVMGDLKE